MNSDPLAEIPRSRPIRKIDFTKSKIPRTIYQTFKTHRVPAAMLKAASSWIDNNPEFSYKFFDDAEMYDYVKRFACEDFSFTAPELWTAINKIRPGAGKADLFRYLLIYDKGGIYMDIDTVCLKSLSRFVERNDDVVTGIGGRGDFHQWGLIYSPHHPFLKQTIENAVHNILTETFVPGFENSLEGLAGPPCLDWSIKQVLKQPPNSRFLPGIYQQEIDGKSFKVKILPRDFFGGNVGFKYSQYKSDLGQLGVAYWMDEPLFNP